LQVCVAPDFAETTLRRHGKSFHFASRFLDPHYARRATRLYAFSRFVDDLADEAPSPTAAREGLAQVVRELTGEAEASAPTRDFLDLARETGMPLEPVLALIDGVRSDLGEVAIQTEEELLRYAYGVAGVVGLLMCDVLDVSEPAARPFAIDLGIAMQLTNIARDVAEDAARGRRYVPETWIGPISATAILLPEPSLRPVLQSALKRLLSLADRFYASGESGLGYLPTRARFAILVAARVYRRIGHRIAQNDHATWCGRAWVSGPEKVLVASGAAISFGLHEHLHTRRRIHDARLHRALEGLPGTHAVG
jgi:phytoene synthase